MAKLVEVLARELSEWPGNAAFLTLSRVDNEIYAGGNLCDEDDTYMLDPSQYTKNTHDEDEAYPIVTRAMWQSERDRQKGGGWKRHRGGDQPKSVSDGEMVEVRLRCGEIQVSQADEFIWNHGECDHAANIMAYRVLEKPEQEEKEVDNNGEAVTLEYQICGEGEEPKPDAWQEIGGNPQNIGTITYTVDLNTEPAMQKIEELQAKWGQLDGPIKWRDGIAELEAYIEEFTRERNALINRLAEEGFALLPHNTPAQGVSDQADMQDWRNWKVGDILTSNSNYDGQFSLGTKYVISRIYESFGEARVSVAVDDLGKSNGWAAREFSFHSRP